MKRFGKLIMTRHGQSDWNKRNLFTGWVDIPLSSEGIQEALEAGRKIADIPVDVIFTSSLIRAQMTAMLVMSMHKGGRVPRVMHPKDSHIEKWSKIYSPETESVCIPTYTAWELNERMYGALQGLNKKETVDKFGEAQVKIWRRSYDVPPPEGESLEMTAKRAIPYFTHHILPLLEKGKNVYIAAHGNSLRSIVMYLDNLSKEQVLELEIATGSVITYEYTGQHWRRGEL